MHETGLSEAIVAAAVRRAAGRRITGLRVRIGGHSVDPDVVTQGIQVAAVGTVVADAVVDLVLEPMTVCCHDCGRDAPITDHLAMVACPQCGGVDIDVTGSDDVVLESVTVASVEMGAV
ncbi:hydrogenase/urease maturation nickel metallochaperone HypA [Micromonospora sp. SL1-18]|uniref:hydrogenase/urease maturation nickel metallochaperone HypA n=1 Tax=Micromonospora sp. SL1-18 TaxID=3399128 RepID=UPI003A4DF93A